MPIIAYCLVITLTLFAGPMLVLAAAKPVPGEIMLAIGPTAVFERSMVPAAGGRIIGPDLARFGAFVQSEQAEFEQRLLENGAWFVVDGRRIAAFCGVKI